MPYKIPCVGYNDTPLISRQFVTSTFSWTYSHLRKGQNLELTSHQDDLSLPLVHCCFCCFKSLVLCYHRIWSNRIKSTISQHIPHSIRFGKFYFASLTKSFHGCPAQVVPRHKIFDQSFWEKYSRCLIRSSSYMQEVCVSTIKSGN